MNGPLALFTTAAFAAGHIACRGGGRWWWVASAVCCGLGVLTKGPVAGVLVTTLGVMGTHPIWSLRSKSH
jgi:4-amino-4-deoxy-L-arabinose transferase-like glycosyltransferase